MSKEFWLTLNEDGSTTYICLNEKLDDRPQLELTIKANLDVANEHIESLEKKFGTAMDLLLDISGAWLPENIRLRRHELVREHFSGAQKDE